MENAAVYHHYKGIEFCEGRDLAMRKLREDLAYANTLRATIAALPRKAQVIFEDRVIALQSLLFNFEMGWEESWLVPDDDLGF